MSLMCVLSVSWYFVATMLVCDNLRILKHAHALDLETKVCCCYISRTYIVTFECEPTILQDWLVGIKVWRWAATNLAISCCIVTFKFDGQ